MIKSVDMKFVIGITLILLVKFGHSDMVNDRKNYWQSASGNAPDEELGLNFGAILAIVISGAVLFICVCICYCCCCRGSRATTNVIIKHVPLAPATAIDVAGLSRNTNSNPMSPPQYSQLPSYPDANKPV